ncbi:flippase [Polynucleobacter campilacus]|uniref:flippase n=1 Tax=Polynucleobacter campilacus TaxID=1743163 RepID=UPI0013748115|nr:flippase [Polynucleobacter campilacus]
MLEGKEGLHAAIHNSGWIFFDKILRALLGVLVGAWVARYLGPSQFGELAYCIAFIGIFQSVTNLGLDGIVVREIANHPRRANIILGTTFQLRLLIGTASWAVALLIYGFTNSFADQGIWIIALVGAGMIFQVADTVDLWFQGNSQSKRTVLAKVSAYLISNAIRVALILFEAPLMAFAIVIALEGALTAIALHFSYKRFPCNGMWQKHYPEAKKLLQESWPYLISGLSIMLYMRIDQIMIKSMLGERELGIFAAIIPISSLWNMIPVAICASIAPMFARKRSEGIVIFNAAMVNMFRLFWVLCLLVIAVTWLLSGLVVQLMYGQAYIEAIPVLNIYVLTCIPVFMGVGQGLWLLNERKSYLSPIQTVTGAVVSIITNLMFIPLWGIEGAAVAAVIAQLSSCFLINSIFARNLFVIQMGFHPRVTE